MAKTTKNDSKEEIADEVQVTLPVGEEKSSREFPPQHLHLRLNLRAARALDRIRQGADERGMSLDSQKRVVNTADAVQFVFQQLAETLGIK